MSILIIKLSQKPHNHNSICTLLEVYIHVYVHANHCIDQIYILFQCINYTYNVHMNWLNLYTCKLQTHSIFKQKQYN